jgi:hypothetical protein
MEADTATGKESEQFVENEQNREDDDDDFD